jgi:hypothetical protein
LKFGENGHRWVAVGVYGQREIERSRDAEKKRVES